MEEIQLNVQIREKTGKQSVRAIRRQQAIPAVIYGGDESTQAISIDQRTFERLERAHHGESFLIRLNIFKDQEPVTNCAALIKEIQHDPVSSEMTHVDFIRVSLKKKIEVQVPIVASGDAIGVKEGGSLDHHLWELDLICLPTNIPKNIVVDVAGLKIGDAILVKNLVLPEGIRTDHDPEDIVLSVVPPMREEGVETPESQEGSVEPEIIKKEKKKEEAPQEEEPIS